MAKSGPNAELTDLMVRCWRSLIRRRNDRESAAYWFLTFTVAAGFWLVYGIDASEFRRWRERRISPSTDQLSP